jgi:threonine aldolase
VNELQTFVANLLGKESALYVVSGVMGNQLCVMSHCKKGDEIIGAKENHIFENENAAAALLAGV